MVIPAVVGGVDPGVTIALAAGAVFVGAALQSATGLGSALVAAPLLFALLGPQEAVSAGILLGLELNLLTLLTEHRRRQVLASEAATILAWSLPGLALGAIALRELDDQLLSALVGLAVLAGLAMALRPRPAAPVARARPLYAAAAGASSGALSTATSLSGPPLAFYLLARDASPAQMRDTLAAIFVALAVLSAPALVLTGTFQLPDAVWVLLLACLAGQLVGRLGFARLGDRHEKAVLAVLGLTALVALAATVA